VDMNLITGELAGPTEILARMGLVNSDEEPVYESLVGGVSSEIVRVDSLRGRMVFKRALAKLKVESDWSAPLERNSAEVQWMKVVKKIVPNAVPEILGQDKAAFAFAMDYLDPELYPVSNDANFYALRLEPYFLAVAAIHSHCRNALGSLIETTAETRLALIHGDVSPKNILVGANGPVFLDAECASYGDPAFDLAFCLNQLLLKCVWRPAYSSAYLECFDLLASTYLSKVCWESVDDIEQRVAALIPGMLVARVDGKSPAEYIIRDSERRFIRTFGIRFLLRQTSKISTLRAAWSREFDTFTNI
jgi:tRNA A-37 threonylcarbamoyl transferase component Bud32